MLKMSSQILRRYIYIHATAGNKQTKARESLCLVELQENRRGKQPLNRLPKPVLVHRQIAGHYLSSCVSHSINEVAPSWSQGSDEEICFSSHHEIYKGVICASLTAQTGLILCHGYIATLTCHICEIETPIMVKFSFFQQLPAYRIIREVGFHHHSPKKY